MSIFFEFFLNNSKINCHFFPDKYRKRNKLSNVFIFTIFWYTNSIKSNKNLLKLFSSNLWNTEPLDSKKFGHFFSNIGKEISLACFYFYNFLVYKFNKIKHLLKLFCQVKITLNYILPKKLEKNKINKYIKKNSYDFFYSIYES